MRTPHTPARARSHRFQAALLSYLPLLLMCALALREGIVATSGLEWPWDRDQFRNIAQAQTSADGGWLSDPFYRDEGVFYNPLLAWLIAAVSRVTGLGVPACYTRLGAYLNLLGPLAFYLALRRGFGPVVAAAATFHLLFLNVRLGASGEPFWANPTYSPWMVAQHLAQPFFFLCLLVYGRARLTGRRLDLTATGALLGLTFLAHTAPFALMTALLLVDALWAAFVRTPRKALEALASDLAWIFVSAGIVAAPFLYSIAVRYQVHVRNAAPMAWRWIPPLEQAGPALAGQLSWASLLVLAGLALLLRRRPVRLAPRLLLILLATCFVFFGYAFLVEWLARKDLHLLEIVPQHHFWFHLRMLESALVGRAVAALWRWSPRRWPATVALTLLVGLGMAVVHPHYRAREGLAVGRAARQRLASGDDREPERSRVVAWMRGESAPGDVFLASDLVGLLVVAPAGRKVVAVDRFFSNPYVDLRPRAAARDLLFSHLKRSRRRAFLALAREWGVRYVMLWTAEPLELGESTASLLEPAYQSRYYSVYRVRSEPLEPR